MWMCVSVQKSNMLLILKCVFQVVALHHYISHNSFYSKGAQFKKNYGLFFQSGHFSEDMIPTVGFNMRKVTKGNVTIKVL